MASAATKRQRSGSAFEEKIVSDFVDSCVGFTTNVSFHGSSELLTALPTLANHLLILGTEPEILAAAKVLPFQDAAVAAAVTSCNVGGIFGVSVQALGGLRRVIIGKVPTEASRHNCPLRPDAMTSIIGTALKEGAGIEKLDVFVASPSSETRCIAAAVARGVTRSLSAKGGLGHTGAFLKKGIPVRVFFPAPTLASSADELSALATSVQLCMRLVDAPPTILDTVTFAEIATLYAKKLGCDVRVISGEDLREGGYGGIYGVGKAAEFPPALVTLTYAGKGVGEEPKKRIAMVGKGIIYDTGGLAIKNPYTNMVNMKTDMGGAAAVLCAFIAAVRTGLPHQLSVTLCLADNAIGPRSYRNDDVLLLKSGLSIEVVNTDAEGRLVLSDGVHHAANELPFTPEEVITMATLTGAQSIATGKRHAAIYASQESSETRIVAAGRRCGDTCFPVLYCPEYHNEEFSSKVADFKNLTTQASNANVSCAGQFIGNSLKSFKGSFVHVDLAGPSSDAGGATGYGVALGYEYLKSL